LGLPDDAAAFDARTAPASRTFDVAVREAREADIAAMREVDRRAAQLSGTDPGYEYCAPAGVRDVAGRQRALAAGKTFVAKVADAVIGFAMIEPLDGEAHLVEIDVDPIFQGKGAARRLIEEAGVWAKSKGLLAMTLTTDRDIPRNAPFYARLGFVAFEPEPDRPGRRAIIQREKDGGLPLRPGSQSGRRCK
jgi:GNAT superfamily N-acetyltransferase